MLRIALLIHVLGTVLAACGGDDTSINADVPNLAETVGQGDTPDVVPALTVATLTISRPVVGVQGTEPLVVTATVILRSDATPTIGILGEVLLDGVAIARFNRVNNPADDIEAERSRAFEASIPPSMLFSIDLATESLEQVSVELEARFVTSDGDTVSRNVLVRVVCGPEDRQHPHYWFCDGTCGADVTGTAARQQCGGCGFGCSITPQPFRVSESGCKTYTNETPFCGSVLEHRAYAASSPPSETCATICARYSGATNKPGICVDRCNKYNRFSNQVELLFLPDAAITAPGHGAGVGWYDEAGPNFRHISLAKCDEDVSSMWSPSPGQTAPDGLVCCCAFPR